MSSTPTSSTFPKQLLLPNTALSFVASASSEASCKHINPSSKYSGICSTTVYGVDRHEFQSYYKINLEGDETFPPQDDIALRQQQTLHLLTTCAGRGIEQCKLFQSTIYAFDYILMDGDLLLEGDPAKVVKHLFSAYANDKRFKQRDDHKKAGAKHITNWTVMEEFVWLACSIGNDRRQRFGSNFEESPLRLAVIYTSTEQKDSLVKLLLQDRYKRLFDLFNVECTENSSFFSSMRSFIQNGWALTVRAVNEHNNKCRLLIKQQQQHSRIMIGNLNSSATVSVLMGRAEDCLGHGYLPSMDNENSVIVRILATSNNNQDHIRPNQCITLYPNEIGAVKRIVKIIPMMFTKRAATESQYQEPKRDEVPRASFGDVVQLVLATHEEFGDGGLKAQHGLKFSPTLAFIGSDDFFVPRSQLNNANNNEIISSTSSSSSSSDIIQVPLSTAANPQDYSYYKFETRVREAKKQMESSPSYNKPPASRTGDYNMITATLSDPRTTRSFADKLQQHAATNPLVAEVPSATPLRCYNDGIKKSFFDLQNTNNSSSSKNNTATYDTRSSFATTTPLFASLVRLSDICPEVLSHCPVSDTLRSSITSLRHLYATSVNTITDEKNFKRSRENEDRILTSSIGEFFLCGPHGMSLATTVLRRTFEGYSPPHVPKEEACLDHNDKTGKPCVYDVTLRAMCDRRFGPFMLTKEQEDTLNKNEKSNFYGKKFRQPGSGDELKEFLKTHPLVMVVHCSPVRGDAGLILEPFVLLRVASPSTFASGVISCLENKQPMTPEMMTRPDHPRSPPRDGTDSPASMSCSECSMSFASLNDIFPEVFNDQIKMGRGSLASNHQMIELRFTLIQLLTTDLSSLFQYDRGMRSRLVQLQSKKFVEIDDDTGDAEEKPLLLKKSLETLLAPSTDASVTQRNLASLLSCIGCDFCACLWFYELLMLGVETYDLSSTFEAPSHKPSKWSKSKRPQRLSSRIMPIKQRMVYYGVNMEFTLFQKVFISNTVFSGMNPYTFLLFSSVLNRRAMNFLVSTKTRSKYYALIYNEEASATNPASRCLSFPETSIIPDIIGALAGNASSLRRLIQEKTRYQNADLLRTGSSAAHTIVSEIDRTIEHCFDYLGLLSYPAISILLRWFVGTKKRDFTVADMLRDFTQKLIVDNYQGDEYHYACSARDFRHTLIRRLPWINSFIKTPLVQNLSNNPRTAADASVVAASYNKGAVPNYFSVPVARPYLPSANSKVEVQPKIIDSIGKYYIHRWIGARFARYDENQQQSNNNCHSGMIHMIIFEIMTYLTPVVVTNAHGSINYSLTESVLFGA